MTDFQYYSCYTGLPFKTLQMCSLFYYPVESSSFSCQLLNGIKSFKNNFCERPKNTTWSFHLFKHFTYTFWCNLAMILMCFNISPQNFSNWIMKKTVTTLEVKFNLPILPERWLGVRVNNNEENYRGTSTY